MDNAGPCATHRQYYEEMTRPRPNRFAGYGDPVAMAPVPGPGATFPGDLQSFQRMIDGLPEQIALLGSDWTILAVNEAWTRSVEETRQYALALGRNYRDFCAAHADANADAAAVLTAVDQFDKGRRAPFRHLYSATGPGLGHDYQVAISRIELGGRPLAIVARYEVTELRTLEQEVRRLGSDLLRLQEQERQRIGRDIHDSTAQSLVALHLCLIRLKALHDDAETRAVLAEVDDTLDRVNHEIRAISYLLHSPSVEHGKLVEALEDMARGFARRTGLDITFDFEGLEHGWDAIVEATLYRLAQEALANVQRHAHGTQARVRLVARPRGFLHLLVEDDGVGIALSSSKTSSPFGVGIAGMRARVAELGGRFSIRRCARGTCLRASIPVAGEGGMPLGSASRRRPRLR